MAGGIVRLYLSSLGKSGTSVSADKASFLAATFVNHEAHLEFVRTPYLRSCSVCEVWNKKWRRILSRNRGRRQESRRKDLDKTLER